MKTITLTDLLQEIDANNGNLEVILHTMTKPRLNKKHRETKEPCPYSNGVLHVAERPAILGQNYEDEVNQARLRELNLSFFMVDPLWETAEPDPERYVPKGIGAGKHINTIIVEHQTTKYRYLCYRPKQNEKGSIEIIRSEYIDLSTAKPLCNEAVDALRHYLPPLAKDSGRQDVKMRNAVAWRTVGLERVKGIQFVGNSDVLQLKI